MGETTAAGFLTRPSRRALGATARGLRAPLALPIEGMPDIRGDAVEVRALDTKAPDIVLATLSLRNAAVKAQLEKRGALELHRTGFP